MAKCGGFDKSGTEAATEWEASEVSECVGLPAGKFDGSGYPRIAQGSLDFDIKNVGLGLSGNRAGNDAGQAYLLTRKRPKKTMQATAGVFQCGDESRSI